MKRGFASWELPGTDVLGLGCRARLGLHLPLRLQLCHRASLLRPGSALHVPSCQDRAGTQAARAGLCVGWEKDRGSERGGGHVGTANSLVSPSPGSCATPCGGPCWLQTRHWWTPACYMLLACDASGTSLGLAKGSPCSPHTFHPGRGHRAQRERTSSEAQLCPSAGQWDQPHLGLHCAMQTSPVSPTRTWAG